MSNTQHMSIAEGLDIDETLLGIHAINPFIRNLSASRSIMLSSHLSQALTLKDGDEKIIQTGVESQLSENTFSRKIENDSRVISMHKRYGGVGAGGIDKTVELVVIYEDLVTGEIDCLSVPNYASLHQYFGFSYKWNDEVLSSIGRNTILPKDTILADSPAVAPNGGYKFGLNANVAFISMPYADQDAVVISKSMAKRLTYDIFEKRTIEFGSDKFPLNIYGDLNNYKPFPEIGERIGDDSIIMALRTHTDKLGPALMSNRDVTEFDPLFDEAVYMKSPGGEVVDIKVHTNSKNKKSMYDGMSDLVDEYADALQSFYKELIDTYDRLMDDHYKQFRNKNMRVSKRFNKLMLEAYTLCNPEKYNIQYSYKNMALDLYRVSFVVRYTVTPTIGGKITNMHGIDSCHRR